jgi:hypothetical protein
MIASILGSIGTAPWAKAALRYGAIMLAIVLFLLSIRRSGERVGRISERLEITEKANNAQQRISNENHRRVCMLASRSDPGLCVSRL